MGRNPTSTLLLTLSSLLAIASSAGGQGTSPQAWLYATAKGKADLLVLDPGTGTVVRRIHKNQPTYQAIGLLGLSYWDGAFYAVDIVQINQPDVLVRIHPADATVMPVGTTGFDLYVHSFDVDPTSGNFYDLFSYHLYSIDPATGLTTSIGQVSPPIFPTTIAIDTAGNGYVTTIGDPPPIAHGVDLYRIDLATARATLVGTLHGIYGRFRDLAFAPDGALWGSLDSGTSASGIYKIDISSLNAIHMQAVEPPNGLSFGPLVDASSYCTAKQGSLGCTPQIGWWGVPSPTAASGFDVSATGVLNGVGGFLTYSASAASTPFLGGTLCVGSPAVRTLLQSSGGTAGPPQDCSGSWFVDLNAEMTLHGAFPPGTSVHCQWWGRDPLSSPYPATLSAGLRVVLQP